MDRRRRAARTVALMSLFTMADAQTDVPIASFDGDGSDLISLIVGIDPVQAGSGDPSPDNVRPISGWTEAKVTRTGINVWDGVTESGYINVNTGEELSSENQKRSLFVSCKPSTNYVYVNTNAASGVRMAFYDGAKNYVGMFSNNNSNPQSFTTPQNAKYLRFYWGDTSGISINYPSTATAYEPYQGETYSITFPTSAGTVYGGTLDVTTGKLTATMAMVDLGTMEWGYQSSPPQFYSNGIAETSINWHSWNDIPPLICSRYKPISNALLASSDFCIGYAYNSKQLRVNDSGFTDAASFKTAMSGVQLCYELATPIVYDLTPTEINTLIGTNNIWADTGDIKYIEYNI